MKRQEIGARGITLVNWLESHGNQTDGEWIDTGIIPTRMRTEIKIMQVHNPYNNSYLQGPVGCWNSNNNRYYPVQLSPNGNGLYFSNKNNTAYRYSTVNDLTNPHTIIYNNGSSCACSIDGTIKGYVSDITTTFGLSTMTLFGMYGARPDGTTGRVPDAWRIYYARFTSKQTGQDVGWFLPALDSNGIPCMYDQITNQLFYNQGTGEFLYA